MYTPVPAQRIIPALIPADEQSLRENLRSLRFAHEIQIDVVDGQFVDYHSWPYEPAGAVQSIVSDIASHTIEVDLMVADPLAAAETWLAAGAQMLVFHVESVSFSDLERFLAGCDGVSVGISALNDTPEEVLYAYAPLADYIQVMGIAQIGAQGAPFDERVLGRVARLQHDLPHLSISIDGSVNETTLPRLVSAGIDRFVVGSALLTAPDREERFEQLESLVRAQ